MLTSQLPQTLLIETITACTRRCEFCSWGQDKSVPSAGKAMDWELVESIANQLPADFEGRISPFLINEPLLDKRLLAIVRLFREACPKAIITIATNGDKLAKPIAAELFQAGMTAIGVSIYDRNPQNWLNEKHGMNIVVMDRRNPAAFVENRAGNLAGGKPMNIPCYRPFSMMPIKANGDVVLCCGDLYAEAVMGNLKQQTISEVWLGDRFTTYRKTLKSNRAGLTPCSKCSHKGSASPVNWPASQFK
jgi:radical SAM protein with 4Fe4S-binding SPASM domain